jgi:hypothetical protein
MQGTRLQIEELDEADVIAHNCRDVSLLLLLWDRWLVVVVYGCLEALLMLFICKPS